MGLAEGRPTHGPITVPYGLEGHLVKQKKQG